MHRSKHRGGLFVVAGIVSLTGLILGALTQFAGAATAAPRAITAATPPSCTTAGLVIWLDTEGSGAAGSSYYYLEFTNVSGHTCRLGGYPGVSAITLAGHQLGSAATRNAVGPVREITLHSATSTTGLPPLNSSVTASVALRITDVGAYSAAQCGYTTAAGLRVYPPNQTTAKIVPYPFTGCDRRGANFLGVAPMTKANLPQ